MVNFVDQVAVDHDEYMKLRDLQMDNVKRHELKKLAVKALLNQHRTFMVPTSILPPGWSLVVTNKVIPL